MIEQDARHPTIFSTTGKWLRDHWKHITFLTLTTVTMPVVTTPIAAEPQQVLTLTDESLAQYVDKNVAAALAGKIEELEIPLVAGDPIEDVAAVLEDEEKRQRERQIFPPKQPDVS